MRCGTVKGSYHGVVLEAGRDGVYRAGIPIDPEEPGGTAVRDARRWHDLGTYGSVRDAWAALEEYVSELEAALTCAV